MSYFYDTDDKILKRLEVFVSASQPLFWEFNMLVVWKDPKNGRLYYGFDSGCSCPSPFERVQSISDLNLLNKKTLSEFDSRVRRWEFSDYDDDGRGNTKFIESKHNVLRKVNTYLYGADAD